jgi:hypothetical protein
MQRLIRPTLTLLLLFVSMFLPFAAARQTFEIGNAGCSHLCCRRKGTHDCPGSRVGSAGTYWTMGRTCVGNCLLAGPVPPIHGAMRVLIPSAMPGPLSAGTLGGGTSPHSPCHYPLSLRQRPPPAS